MGGLGFYSEGDVINYPFLASHLHNGLLQAKFLANSDLFSLDLAFEQALLSFLFFVPPTL